MNKIELNALMINIQNNDENSFCTLYKETYKGVFSFLYTYTHNYQTTEDLLQDTYMKLRINAQSYKQNTNVVAWLLQIAKNTALDYLRKNKIREFDEFKENVCSNNENIVEKLYLHNLIYENLSTVDRQIVILHIVYGYKSREIAKILNIPMGTVLWRYNKSIKTLQEKIKEVDDER